MASNHDLPPYVDNATGIEETAPEERSVVSVNYKLVFDQISQRLEDNDKRLAKKKISSDYHQGTRTALLSMDLELRLLFGLLPRFDNENESPILWENQ